MPWWFWLIPAVPIYYAIVIPFFRWLGKRLPPIDPPPYNN